MNAFPKKRMSKKRRSYILVTIILIIIEVLIALFVHDDIIRPYIGDVLVVFAIYTFVRSIILDKCKCLSVFVFAFACFVEGLQAIEIVKILGLESNRFFNVLIGSVFDVKDIICYGVGCLILGLYDIVSARR